MLQIALTAFATYDVLRLFGISLPALRVGGGILLLLASIGIIGILLAALAAEMILQGIGESGALRAAGR
jgi:small neutral amino acid transporter SnatA (MarC family)